MKRFKRGDRVSREIDIYDLTKGLRFGIIIKVYRKPVKQYNSFKLGPYPELYKVLWDDGKTEEGFLPHGLNRA